MSKLRRLFLTMVPVGVAAFTLAASAADVGRSSADLKTYETASGETYFALSLSPTIEAPAEARHDVVVLFDTSASQTGPYRTDALAALRTLLDRLPTGDRVKLVAVDVDSIDLTPGFVAPGGTEAKEAIARLEARAPLGSTNMSAALQSVLDSFAKDGAGRRAVVYIGDGMSPGGAMSADEFGRLAGELVSRRAPVSSVAIGPRRDTQFLAALANQTGGRLYIDSSDPTSAQRAGEAMAEAVQGVVFWPAKVEMPQSVREIYPRSFPPLRSDRDAVAIGVLDGRPQAAQKISMTAELDGRPVQLSWTVTAAGSNPDLGYLPELVEMVRGDGGLSLPTAGSAALREAGRVLTTSADDLAGLGAEALRRGDLQGAKDAAEAAIKRDPTNPQALALRHVIERKAGDDPELRMASLKGAEAVAPDEAPKGLFEDEGNLLDQVEAQKAAQAGAAEMEVKVGLSEARKKMATDPQRAKEDLKLLQEKIADIVELKPDRRAVLAARIESAIQQASRLEVEQDEQRRMAEENMAAAAEAKRLVDETQRRRETIKQLMDRFNSLMDEGRYLEADADVAKEVQQVDPGNTAAMAGVWRARFTRQTEGMKKFRDLRHKNFADVLYEVEEAAIPFTTEPPIVYPDADTWVDLSVRRKKYAAFDLARQKPSEKKIYDALDDETVLEFIETPLQDVIDYISDAHDIPIIFDYPALESAPAGPDTPITINLHGVTLRSGLKLLLKQVDMTYVVKDEVMQITTQQELEDNLDLWPVKVYPVGDLVMPILSGMGGMGMMGGGMMGGGMMGGGMGGFGGGMGGFGGGMGGFGGGMGGFGGGMGGFGGGGFGGGFFAVEDELKLGGASASEPSTPAAAPQAARAAAQPVSAIQLDRRPGESLDKAWDRHFAAYANADDARQLQHDAAVRETARKLINSQQFAEAAAMIRAALRYGQAQSWMYEALGLALQAMDAPKSEIERALLSAVDLSGSPEAVLNVAIYMSRIGLEQRALKIFRQLAAADPTQPDPYVYGLAAAQRIDDQEAIQWACLGILSQAWPKSQEAVEKGARRIAQAQLLRLQKEQKLDQYEKFKSQLDGALQRDCVVKVTWTGDADVDLSVEEPAGTVCSLRNPRTASGGVILGDTYSVADAKPTDGYSEVYVCPRGFSGQYRMLLRRVWGKVTAGKVTLDIFTNYASPQQKHIHRQIELGDKDAVVLFDVNQGRRKEPLAEQRLATLQRDQMALGREVLAQQLNALENSSASLDFALARRRAQSDGRFFWPIRGGAVGFRPVIRTLPSGTTFFVNGIISADRRYVRISPTPVFSSIGQVVTFNFGTGQQTTTGGGTGGATTP